MPKEEAIQEDVSKIQHPRMDIIKSMGEKRRDELVGESTEEIEETNDVNDEALEASDEVVEESASEEVNEHDGEQDTEEKEPPVYLKEGKWYTKRKVNGKEEEVEFERVLANHQKDVSAEARLEEAARARKALEQREAEINAKAAEIKRQQEEIEKSRQSVSQEKFPELLSEYHEALSDFDQGDPESVKRLQEAQDKLNEHYNAGRNEQPSIDEDQVINKAIVRMKSSQWSQNLEKANNWLYSEQDDLDVNDDYLHNLATVEAEKILGERLKEGQKIDPSFTQFDVDPIEVYKAAVSRTKEWLDAKTGTATNQARVDRKRSATGSSVTGKNARATIKDNTPKVKTQAERIREMREARGMPT